MSRQLCAVLVWTFVLTASALQAGGKEIHPVIAQLLNPELRQDAFVEIVSWQKYPVALRHYSYRAKADKKVVDVVVCPQTHGTPLYAVLTELVDDARMITLLDDDGTLFPLYQGRHVFRGELIDVNDDGVLDKIDVGLPRVRIGDVEVFLNELHVVPVTREQKSVLTVVFQRRMTPHPPRPVWSWELQANDLAGTDSIVLGPKDPESGSIKPEAVYSWSAAEKRWLGPAGGMDQPFLRIEGPSSQDRREYASAALARIVGGQVTDKAGQPLSVARVRYRLTEGEVASDWSEKPFITGSDGRFGLGKLEPDRSYEIRVEKQGFASASVKVGGQDSPADLRIELQRPASKP